MPTFPCGVPWQWPSPKSTSGFPSAEYAGGASPCGPAVPHYFCRQFGYCLFGQTPTFCPNADAVDKFNAKCMAAATWLFFIFAIIAAAIYDEDEKHKEGSIGKGLRKGWGTAWGELPHEIWCGLIIGNSVLSIFPTYYSLTICNIFHAGIIANAVWSVGNLMGTLAFLHDPFYGFSYMMWVMGWGAAMFTVTAGKKAPYSYGAAILFIGLCPFLGTKAAHERNMSDFWLCIFVASFFLGFMMWSALESYTHVHNFLMAPDPRLWSYPGPFETQVPVKKEVPAAWDGTTDAEKAAAGNQVLPVDQK